MSPASSSIRSASIAAAASRAASEHALLHERDQAQVGLGVEQAPHQAAADEAREAGEEVQWPRAAIYANAPAEPCGAASPKASAISS